jgi:hypothetical protein
MLLYVPASSATVAVLAGLCFGLVQCVRCSSYASSPVHQFACAHPVQMPLKCIILSLKEEIC